MRLINDNEMISVMDTYGKVYYSYEGEDEIEYCLLLGTPQENNGNTWTYKSRKISRRIHQDTSSVKDTYLALEDAMLNMVDIVLVNHDR